MFSLLYSAHVPKFSWFPTCPWSKRESSISHSLSIEWTRDTTSYKWRVSSIMHSLSCLLLLTMFQQLQCRHASYQSVSEQNLQSLGWDHRQVIYWRPWCLCVWCADGSHGAYMLALLLCPWEYEVFFSNSISVVRSYPHLNSKKTIFTRWAKL